jgi:prepilin-type processing-associated H-X9-DG protein
VFCGYFIIPHQDVERWSHLWDYKIGGIEAWHSRTKFGGEFLRAPIVVDRIVAVGVAKTAESVRIVNWMVGSGDFERVPFSSHAGRHGVSEGGNFLFEDGHVSWHRREGIDLAMKAKLDSATYLYFYRIKIEVP